MHKCFRYTLIFTCCTGFLVHWNTQAASSKEFSKVRTTSFHRDMVKDASYHNKHTVEAVKRSEGLRYFKIFSII